MEVIALVEHVQAGRLREALLPGDAITRVSTWDSLFRHLTTSDDGAAVLNPPVAESGGLDSSARLSAVARLRTTPFVVYVKLTDLRSVMPFIRGGAADVILEDHTDSRKEIQDALCGARGTSGELILRHVLAPLADSHSEVIALIAEVFRSPNAVANAAALTRSSTISERTLYRAVADGGLAPLGVIVRVARAARAFDLMRQHRFTLERAAHALEYSSARQLSRHLRDITGLPSMSASASLPQRWFVEAALRQLFRRREEAVG